MPIQGPGDPLKGGRSRGEFCDGGSRLSVDRIAEVFSPTGVLAKVLAPQFEWRPQQAELADAVYRVLRNGGSLVAEAPTGVGKSLSYLYPAILWAIDARETVLVSTHTKALQEQILEKEIPRLRRIFDRELRVVLLKGRANYLCRNRYRHYAEEVRGTTDGERALRLLEPWAEWTATGDLAEAPPLDPRDQKVLQRIASDARFCATGRCTPETGCFHKLSRQEAKDAHLVVVNHALLVLDLLGQGTGIPPWSSVIIDESHHLPSVMVEPLSFAVSEGMLDALLKGMGGRGEPGCSDALRRVSKSHPDRERRGAYLEDVRTLESETGRMQSVARGFFEELRAARDFPRAGERKRYGIGTEVTNLIPPSGLDLCQALNDYLGQADRLIEGAATLEDSSQASESSALLEARHTAEELKSAVRALATLVTPDDRNCVYWVEPETPRGPTLRQSPIEVGSTLRSRLFETRRSVVLTSATLAIGDRFDHMLQKLGADASTTETLRLESPFQQCEQVRAWTMESLEEPGGAGYADALADGLALLSKKLRRKMLVLFTSHEMLRAVASRVRAPLEETGIRLFAQEVDGGQAAVRSGFLEGGPAVLLGAASFWEGMDFPGAELEVLVLARLPFLVPTDPIVEAISERIASEGGVPFQEYYLPEAILRFRQGFGRLIRRRDDRGIFVVADSRVVSKSYGRQFQKAIGLEFVRAGTFAEVAEGAERFFDES